MKKILAILFVISVFNSVLIAESYISAGSFASFFDNDDRYSPSLITLKAGSDRFFDNGAVFSADLEFMYGFPSSSGLDMLYTNYFNGSTRFLAGYDHKKKIFTGSVTNLSFFSGSDSYSTEVTQGISSFSMKRDSYITEELFVAGSLLDKKFNFLIDLGYKYQQFSKLEDSTGITMNGTFQD
ncbi:MAG TPA: hypothetical protein VLJ60_08700, partial [bacterium]|nr:hypothetical protein [bacterium]